MTSRYFNIFSVKCYRLLPVGMSYEFHIYCVLDRLISIQTP